MYTEVDSTAEYVPAPRDDRAVLRDRVYLRLKGDIVAGTLPSGARLTESSLTAQYDVSRTPVREALQMLQAEGFVERRRRGGVTVLRLNDQDVSELFQLRIALERQSADEAAQRMTEADLRGLAKNVSGAVEAAGANDVPGLIRLNAAFHLEIASLSGNSRLVSMLKSIHETINVFRVPLFTNVAEAAASGHGHRFLLDAFRAALMGVIRPETVGLIMHDHVANASRALQLHRKPGGTS